MLDTADGSVSAHGQNIDSVAAHVSGIRPDQRRWAGNGSYEADGNVIGGEDAISFGPNIPWATW